ncbi:MAG: hypothetical protein PHG16_01145 [Lachnospiraceae bacterium]|nr:hypothetical protein [Lachnospiraceae bacterium]
MKEDKKIKKAKKGTYGYIRWQKCQRLVITLALFALPLTFFIVGMVLNKGDRKNIYTLIAVVGCLPACRSTVNLILIWTQHSIMLPIYEELSVLSEKVCMVYELYLTTYEKNLMVEAAAICGEEVACFAPKADKNITFFEEHMQKILRANGYKSHVKIFTDKKHFSERVLSLDAHYDELERGANEKFRPDEQYPDLSRDELVKHNLMAIAL